MTDNSYDETGEGALYVAPKEPPPSRKPPVATTGLWAWLRENLFSSWLNTLLTIIVGGLAAAFVIGMTSWMLFDAEWNVINGNVRLLMVGQYSAEQLWRVELLALFLVFLSGVSLGIWSGNVRAFGITAIITIIVLVLIPLGASSLAEPPVRTIVGPESELNPLFFPGDEGQTITIATERITQEEATADDTQRTGYIETTPGLSNSRIVWNELKADASAEDVDLDANFDMVVTVELRNGAGELVEAITSTPGEANVSAEVELPATDWYYIIADRDDESSAGYIWVRLDGVPTYTNRVEELEARTETYGELPEYECPTSAECRAQLIRNNLRFEGTRTFSEYVKIQAAPFFNSIGVPVLVALGLAAVGVAGGTMTRSSGEGLQRLINRAVVASWILLFPVSWVVLRGIQGSEILPPVPTSVWGGLMLTLMLTFVSIAASFPISILLALGRRSNLPVLSLACTAFIEVVRGVPLITILFFAKLIVPFFADALTNVDDVIRMMIGLTLFTAAYQAEVIRGGLQIIPKGQTEAAYALGLNNTYTLVFITLPQALRAVIPAMMSQFVSLFKDTTLVSIVGLFELLGIVEFIVNGQQANRTLQREAYIFVGVIYFVISYIMSSISRRLESTGSGAARR